MCIYHFSGNQTNVIVIFPFLFFLNVANFNRHDM